MMLTKSTVPLLGMIVTSIYLTFAFDVANVATQAPDDSNGWHLPEGAAAERNLVPVNDALLARGQSLYKAKCQRCHGADGAGHGPEADPDHPAGDLTDGRAALRNPDGVMFYKIWNGRAKPKMPAMKTDMTRTDVWTVIHYVKTLRKSS
jgi:mono/diheme cytochrome c family protein